MKTKVSVVIVFYNGMKWLPKCLRSCDPYNVIAVDNNSTDGTVSFIKENFPEITILQQSENLGFGAANNIGISHALNNGADYVFLLNQDAYLEPNTINHLIKCHKENTVFGVISPMHLNGNGEKMDYNFSKYIKDNKELQYDIQKQLYTQQIYEIPFINAAAWLLPRNAIERIGGFDPIFHHYGEDVNYCQRILYHHLKIGVVPEVYIRHDREFRPKRILNNKTEKLAHFERGLKQGLANINKEIERHIKKKKQILLKQSFKSFFKLMFRDALFNLIKYKLLNSVLPEIKNSRKKNKGVGLHYLDA
ncbi:glycosyltransferase family 2 protein [Hyunsoonleella aestuarii]|uniref:Glycosyltransferase family 2 protein n=1 Tax=Hyunsoonleella aestuarii TaxID=912802 RepID=A0ABP8E756_9FLAO|nr:glycosyltransferase family 2 protein [Hyunsoonleella aestuarii]